MKADLLSLAARLEQEPEGSRELDALIWCARFGYDFVRMQDGCPDRFFYDPRVKGGAKWGHHLTRGEFASTSVDASLLLVPEGWGWQVGKSGATQNLAMADIWATAFTRLYKSTAFTAPLALCAACLRAIAASPDTQESA